MSIRQKLFVLAIAVLSFPVLSIYSFAEPIQLFLDPTTAAVIRRPLTIEIFVLNENGEIEVSFEGKNEVRSGLRSPGFVGTCLDACAH